MPQVSFDTAGWHQWNVPNKLKKCEVDLFGGGSDPVHGGRVVGQIDVEKVDSLWFYVGEAANANSGGTGGVATSQGADVGGGGKGGNGSNKGGYSGAGATLVRINAKTGGLKGVAGGAGGRSGDWQTGVDTDGDPIGAGGQGGTQNGEPGWRGNSGTAATTNALGGSPTQGGVGGTSSATPTLNGSAATDALLARGGAGGGGGLHGGGGGGGGYRAGGGGQGSSSPVLAPGGGGGGGSNYSGGIIGAVHFRGNGRLGVGTAQVRWTDPTAQNVPPNIPSSLKIDGRNESSGMTTRNVSQVGIQATLDDNDGDKVRLVVQYSANANFTNPHTVKSDFVEPHSKDHKGIARLELSGLSQDTHYYIRAWAEDKPGHLSFSYNVANFWTNRSPNPPTLTTPAENAQFPSSQAIIFTWTHRDPDAPDPQSAFELQYQVAGNDTTRKSTGKKVTGVAQWISDPYQFGANQMWLWRVRTWDQQNRTNPNQEKGFSEWRSFFVTSNTTPPEPLSPSKQESIDTTQPVTFEWTFRDPNVPPESQTSADLRFRVFVPNRPLEEAEEDWQIWGGDAASTPGSSKTWEFPPFSFDTGVTYEWQVRTHNSAGNVSQWSRSALFVPVLVGSAVQPPLVTSDQAILGSLGCGSYRVLVAQRGGQVSIGEVTSVSMLSFNRVRDDISRCDVQVTGFGPDCGALLADLRTWMHEIVLYRDGERVWEGPITRIAYSATGVTIEAKDVFGYLYRRIMKQGYNDAYRVVGNVQYGQMSVVKRAKQIIMNALAVADPNVLPYLTTFDFPDDATEGRIVNDFSKTAWEEVDDLAATAGLDYVAVGRRIVLFDTHRPIGRLPELRDEDFSDPPIVTEYGMQLATLYAVTNNSGSYAFVNKVTDRNPNSPDFNDWYGPVEILASAYGETDSTKDMTEQSKRNSSNRWPTPVTVRVPDNSTLNPDVNVPFSMWVPGVWIPLRATQSLRQVSQWQKLDSVSVEFIQGVERVMVVMSPAPNGGADPDDEGDTGEEVGSR
jgi:hypothetical protein